MEKSDISFEFFPPKTDQGREKLHGVREALAACSPDFFSVTYGAGGSTQENTTGVVMDIQKSGQQAVPHLSFGGSSKDEVLELLTSYRLAGISRVVALRGDLPSGMGMALQLVHANELVAFIRQHFGDQFEIFVAAYPEIHPEAENYQRDIFYLGEKFRAGANAAITQYFYNADAYFYFIEQCQKAGIDQPIYPGIMPITNYQNLVRFSDNCGADIPRWIREKLKELSQDSVGLKEFGLEVVSGLCQRLREGGAPGFHFYTMNQAEPTLNILKNLDL